MNLEDFKGWIQSFANQVGLDIKALRNDKVDKTAIVSEIDTLLGSSEWQTQKTLEQIQDIVGVMFQTGNHSNASVSYDDANGTINISASGTGGTGLSEEEIEDIVGGFAIAGNGMDITYDDANNTLTFSIQGEIFTTEMRNKLENIQAGAQVNTITGVKGSSEASFRTGNVNITLANLDAGTDDPLTTYTTARDS